MKKVLSIFMAILMVVTMFSFSAVVFAEEPAEPGVEAPAEGEETKEPILVHLGSFKFDATGKNGFGYNPRGKEIVMDLEKFGCKSATALNLHAFNPETIDPTPRLGGNPIGYLVIDAVNALAASGEYSQVRIVTASGATTTEGNPNAVKFVGLKGTADCPIVIASLNESEVKTFENTFGDFAITLKDCENLVVENITAKGTNGGITLENCSDVTFSNVTFEEIAYITYDIGGADDEEATTAPSGDESTSETATEAVTEEATTEAPAEGSATRKNVYALNVGAKCKDIAVENCTFEECRAGVLVDGTGLDAESAPAGVKVVGGKFTKINDAAVIVKNAKDVTVSDAVVGGSEADAVGTSIVDEKFDGEAAAFVLDNAENVTIERVYSTDNMAFINAKASTGRVRYNVSARDDSAFVDSAELLIYNNTFLESTSIELNAVVKNNIFKMGDKTIGEKVKVGEGDNNCYYWTSKGDRGSIRKNPRFANAFDGTVEGTSVRDNYILAEGSPCLGKGVKVEENMGDKDFYGKDVTESINIGADAFGTGAATEIEFASDFIDFFNYIIAVISNFFANLFA